MNSNKFEKLYPRMIQFVKTGSKSYIAKQSIP